MSSKSKLTEGQRKLAKAGSDSDLLQSALISLHGALEDYMREELAAEIRRYEQDNNINRVGWLDLVNLWEKYRSLSSRDKSLILSTNSKRNEVAHGNSISVTRTEVEAYARFVQSFMGVYVSSPPPSPSQRVTPTPTKKPTPPPARPANSPDYRPVNQPTNQRQSPPPPPRSAPASTYEKPKSSFFKRLATAIAVLFVVTGCSMLVIPYYLNQLNGENGANGLVTPPEIDEGAITPDEGQNGSINEKAKTDPTPTQMRSNPSSTQTTIQVVGNSYVRAEPQEDAAVIATVLDDEVYEVLETSADSHWYKIHLASGQEGWLGSTRATVISP